MNLQDAKALALEKMEEHGLIDRRWYFEFDNAKNAFGRCFYSKCKITLSKYLVELNSVEQVLDTILHEIAHALVGPGHNHDEVWRRCAIRIGCNGERCYNKHNDNVVTPKGKYQASCPNCHKVHHRHKQPKAHIRQSCGHCGNGRYNEAKRLIWTLTPVEVFNPRPVHAQPIIAHNHNADISLAEQKRLKRNEQSRLCKQRQRDKLKRVI